jgi:hypothetical protein
MLRMSRDLYMNIEFCYNEFVDFSDWITKKYIEWRDIKTGRSASIAEFAKLFGASHQLMSKWMKKGGMVPKHKRFVDALVKVYGNEVYEVLDLPRPEVEPRAALLAAGFPVDFIDELLAAREEYTAELANKGIETDSPEARSIIREAFSRHGIQLTETVN